METNVYIASRDGAVRKITCLDKGEFVVVSKRDLPKKAFAAFLDDKGCMVEETGRFLDTLPAAALAGHWFFPK